MPWKKKWTVWDLRIAREEDDLELEKSILQSMKDDFMKYKEESLKALREREERIFILEQAWALHQFNSKEERPETRPNERSNWPQMMHTFLFRPEELKAVAEEQRLETKPSTSKQEASKTERTQGPTQERLERKPHDFKQTQKEKKRLETKPPDIKQTSIEQEGLETKPHEFKQTSAEQEGLQRKPWDPLPFVPAETYVKNGKCTLCNVTMSDSHASTSKHCNRMQRFTQTYWQNLTKESASVS